MSAADTAKSPVVTPFSQLGGDDGVRELVERFYDAVERLPEALDVRAMHQDDLGEMREKLYEYLSGWLGGPPLYLERRGPVCIRSAHAPFPIDWAARDQWLACMSQAMDEMAVGGPLRTLLDQAFGRMAEALRNLGD